MPDISKCTPHEVAHLLKYFLSKLPVPLFPTEQALLLPGNTKPFNL
jgi:hypothetical protein